MNDFTKMDLEDLLLYSKFFADQTKVYFEKGNEAVRDFNRVNEEINKRIEEMKK